ncbi:MAG: sirohydrochlorin chelatase [Cyanobacteria bacterium J06627_32]
MKPVVAPTAYLLISHGSRDPRPQEAMNRLADLVRARLETGLSDVGLSDVGLNNGASELDASESKASELDASELDASELDASELRMSPSAVRKAASGTEFVMQATGRTTVLARPEITQSKVTSETTPHVSPNVAKCLQRVPHQSGEQLVADVAAEVIVGTACLELSTKALSEQIYEFSQRLIAAGVTELKLLPMFLMSGVHVMEDIPAEITTARERLGNALTLTVCPHLGSHPQIVDVLAQRLAAVPGEGSLLVAHGSRRPKGNRIINGLAKRLNTAVAYWATPPDIETQVIELMQQGCQKLTILPYFLFAGGITDAITHRTEELAERFPKIQFRLLPTLGATHEVAQLATELIH